MKLFRPKLDIKEFYPSFKKKAADSHEKKWRKHAKCTPTAPCMELGCPVCEYASEVALKQCLTDFHARHKNLQLACVRVEKTGYLYISGLPKRHIERFKAKAVALLSATILHDRDWFGLLRLDPRWIDHESDPRTDYGFWTIDAHFYMHLQKEEQLSPLLVKATATAILTGKKVIISGHKTSPKHFGPHDDGPNFYQFEEARESYDQLDSATFENCLIDPISDGYLYMFHNC
ncbi:MAG TPA: hypothetical protein VM144_04495 [Aestuariivirga sp.]|nr:hypothetical protein [Aestuariivirga sp.]